MVGLKSYFLAVFVKCIVALHFATSDLRHAGRAANLAPAMGLYAVPPGRAAGRRDQRGGRAADAP